MTKMNKRGWTIIVAALLVFVLGDQAEQFGGQSGISEHLNEIVALIVAVVASVTQTKRG